MIARFFFSESVPEDHFGAPSLSGLKLPPAVSFAVSLTLPGPGFFFGIGVELHSAVVLSPLCSCSPDLSALLFWFFFNS